MEARRLGGLFDGETKHQAGSVWDKEFVAPTIDTMRGGCKQPMIIEKKIPCKLDKMPNGSLTSLDNAEICDVGTETASTVTARYYKGIGGHKDNMCIVAMRGRNLDNPSDRTVGAPTEQRLEPNSQGICNTLTSVQKDNLVMENLIIGGEQKHQAVKKDGICTCLTSSMGTGGGYVPMIAPQYRIRKLTPIECWRLMDFSDEDFNKAAEVNSNTQLYKQAGNSIVKNVLVAILGQMIPGKEDVYKKLETR